MYGCLELGWRSRKKMVTVFESLLESPVHDCTFRSGRCFEWGPIRTGTIAEPSFTPNHCSGGVQNDCFVSTKSFLAAECHAGLRWFGAPDTIGDLIDDAIIDTRSKGNRMLVTDFARSFVRFRIDLQKTQPRTISQPPPFTLNNARFSLECRCQISRSDEPSAAKKEYVLSASCKAEQVHVREDIWHQPAADMCLVASLEEFMVIKSWDRNNRGVMLSPPSLGEQPERQVGNTVDAFTELRIDMRELPAEPLLTTQAIVTAVLDNRPLVAKSELTMPGGDRVTLEYPVKVINVSEREEFYQVDTGPVLIPDATAFDGKFGISALRLAFIAHNTLGCTELLLNVPTALSSGISVNHYSQVLKLKATNQIFALGEP